MEQQTLLVAGADTPVETPEGGWPAQPGLTPPKTFLQIAREDVTTLLGVAATLEQPRALRSIAARDELRRTLAGVIAHCETLRLALEKGRL